MPEISDDPIAVMDVGGSHVTAALVLGDRVVARSDADIDPGGTADEILGAIAGAGLELGSFDRWTLAFPGPIDYAAGIGSFEGVGKFAAIAGLELKKELGSRLGAQKIDFVDDADSYGLGEWLAGAARGQSRVVCITLGTGVGASFILDGVAVWDGPGVPPGGNLYPFDYRGRAIEFTVSTRALVESYGSPTSVKEIFERARRGEQHAASVVDETYVHLGVFLAPFLADFAAGILVVGGSISQSWDLIEPPLRRGLGDTDVLTARSELLNDAPLLGAALAASRT